MDLLTIQKLLLDEPFDARYEPADDEVPADRVTIRLAIDRLPGPLYLQVLLVPEDVSSAEDGLVKLQFFTPFPVTVDEDSAAEVVGYLPFLNLESPLMGFNFDPYEQFAYFRHTVLLPNSAAAHQAIVETVWLIYFTLDNLGPEVAALTLGTVGMAALIGEEE